MDLKKLIELLKSRNINFKDIKKINCENERILVYYGEMVCQIPVSMHKSLGVKCGDMVRFTSKISLNEYGIVDRIYEIVETLEKGNNENIVLQIMSIEGHIISMVNLKDIKEVWRKNND